MKEFIIIHHSLTKDNKTVSWQAIRRYHMEDLAFRDVGYHWGIEEINDRFEILMGRTPDQVGAHCKEALMNQRGIGVCLVGNFDLEMPPKAGLIELHRLVRWLMVDFHIPLERVIGHREAGLMAGFDWRKGHYKSCPGKLWDMSLFRQSLV